MSGVFNPLGVATQSEQEAGSSNTLAVSPGRQHYHPSAAKAWVIFDGSGTPAILASYNVASITDNGVGDYTVNFTNSFSSADYAIAGVVGNASAAASTRLLEVSTTNLPTTSACRVFVVFSNTGASRTKTDNSLISLAFFGDM